MKLWERAAGALKDKNSIYLTTISRKTSYRNPDLQAIIIKATSHDDSFVDYKNFQRVYQWLRTSSLHVKPLLWSLSSRMNKTRNWVVAIKGLMLIHGVFCCQIPAVQRIGRLPFDLSSFTSRSSNQNKGRDYNAFVRAYFAYLDQRSVFVTTESTKRRSSDFDPPLSEELGRLGKWQSLLDVLLQVKPQADNMMRKSVIMEAMICVSTEAFEVYIRIKKGISRALTKIYSEQDKNEAALALGILHKATVQVHDLSLFFDLCKKMGVMSSLDCPKVEKISQEDIRKLESIINGVEEDANDKAIVVVREEVNKRGLETIITEKWEVFDEDHPIRINAKMIKSGGEDQLCFGGSSSTMELVPYNDVNKNKVSVRKQLSDLPDLISF